MYDSKYNRLIFGKYFLLSNLLINKTLIQNLIHFHLKHIKKRAV